MAKNRSNPPISNNPIPPTRVERRIVWKVSPDIKTTHVTNLTIQQANDEFVISLFEIIPPLILSPDDVDKFPEVTAECVARFTLTPSRLRAFIQALQDSYVRYASEDVQDDEVFRFGGDNDGAATNEE